MEDCHRTGREWTSVLRGTWRDGRTLEIALLVPCPRSRAERRDLRLCRAHRSPCPRPRSAELRGSSNKVRCSCRVERKSDVEGKSVSVHVALGGRSIIKKKNELKHIYIAKSQ